MAVKVFKVLDSDVSDGTLGICLACGEIAYGVEPDARGYQCEDCGKPQVYGLEEAVLMGRVEISENEDDLGDR